MNNVPTIASITNLFVADLGLRGIDRAQVALDNGYEVSVLRRMRGLDQYTALGAMLHAMVSGGTYELMVCVDGRPCCDTPLGNRPIGHQSEEDANAYIIAAAALPPRERKPDTACAQIAAELAKVKHARDELDWLLNTPETADFLEGVRREAAHQVRRWGYAHDRSKSAENWFWLVGYLAGKALRAAISGDKEKAHHHTISCAAALKNWHAAISGDTTGAGVGQDDDLRAKNPMDAQAADNAACTPARERWPDVFEMARMSLPVDAQRDMTLDYVRDLVYPIPAVPTPAKSST